MEDSRRSKQVASPLGNTHLVFDFLETQNGVDVNRKLDRLDFPWFGPLPQVFGDREGSRIRIITWRQSRRHGSNAIPYIKGFVWQFPLLLVDFFILMAFKQVSRRIQPFSVDDGRTRRHQRSERSDREIKVDCLAGSQHSLRGVQVKASFREQKIFHAIGFVRDGFESRVTCIEC